MPYKRIWIILALLTCFAGYTEADEVKTPIPATATVVSTENSYPYTYVQLNIGGSNIWYAVPSIELNPGEKVFAPAGMPMKDFYSKTLDRTFDLVYFTDSIGKIGTPPQSTGLPAGHPPIQTGLPSTHPPVQTAHPPVQTALPPGHPPIAATTNSASCPLQDAANSCCGNTTSIIQ